MWYRSEEEELSFQEEKKELEKIYAEVEEQVQIAKQALSKIDKIYKENKDKNLKSFDMLSSLNLDDYGDCLYGWQPSMIC